MLPICSLRCARSILACCRFSVGRGQERLFALRRQQACIAEAELQLRQADSLCVDAELLTVGLPPARRMRSRSR